MKKIQPSARDFGIVVAFILVLFLQGCSYSPNNDSTDKRLENGFLAKIKQDGANYFNYLQDGLTTQRSFFMGNKLKYITFRHEPETGFIEGRVIFDLATDSMEAYTLRKVLPGKNQKLNDSLFVFYPKQHRGEVYYGNKMVNTIYPEDIFAEQLHFINALKAGTQKEFNKGQK